MLRRAPGCLDVCRAWYGLPGANLRSWLVAGLPAIRGPGGVSRMTATRAGSPVLHWGREKVVELFGADLRSLAVFRMALAILVLADLAFQAVDLTAHYADDGVLPRSVLLQGGDLDRWAFSLNLMSGETSFQALLFGVGALAALAMLVGYRTRLASVVVWVLVLSIQWRNPLVVFEGDTLLRMLLFWGMFLPLGAYWSVDGAVVDALFVFCHGWLVPADRPRVLVQRCPEVGPELARGRHRDLLRAERR